MYKKNNAKRKQIVRERTKKESKVKMMEDVKQMIKMRECKTEKRKETFVLKNKLVYMEGWMQTGRIIMSKHVSKRMSTFTQIIVCLYLLVTVEASVRQTSSSDAYSLLGVRDCIFHFFTRSCGVLSFEWCVMPSVVLCYLTTTSLFPFNYQLQ